MKLNKKRGAFLNRNFDDNIKKLERNLIAKNG